jgi:hypothetical protein
MQILIFRNFHVNSTELLLAEVTGGVIIIYIFILKSEINLYLSKYLVYTAQITQQNRPVNAVYGINGGLL